MVRVGSGGALLEKTKKAKKGRGAHSVAVEDKNLFFLLMHFFLGGEWWGKGEGRRVMECIITQVATTTTTERAREGCQECCSFR